MASFQDQPRRPSRRYDPTSTSRDHRNDYLGQSLPRSYQRYASYDHHEPYSHDESQHYHERMYEPNPTRSFSYSPPSSWQSNAWPPPPSVEDEAASLQSEADSQSLLEAIGKDEVTNRGAVDQEPIIADISTVKPSDETPINATRNAQKSNKSASGIPTPPTSEDEKERKSRRRTSKLNVNTAAHVPEVSKRTASPYAHTWPNRLSREFAPAKDALTSGSMTPPPSETHARSGVPWAESNAKASRRDFTRPGPAPRQEYFSPDESAIDDNDPTTSAASSARTSVVDFAPPPENTVPARRPHLEARRNTDVPSTLPIPLKLNIAKAQLANSFLSPDVVTESPAAYASSLKPAGPEPYSRSRESSYCPSRGVSPGTVPGERIPHEPQSQRSSWDPQVASQLGYRPESRPGSRPGSRCGSAASTRPSTPTAGTAPRTPIESPRMLRVDMDWSAITAAARRPMRGSRLSASTIPDSQSYPAENASSFAIPFRPASNLPYPEDDGMLSPSILMPSERDHQYFGVPATNVNPLPPQFARDLSTTTGPPSPAGSTASGNAERPRRPKFMREHSTVSISPTETRAPDGRSRNRGPASATYATSNHMKKEIDDLQKKDPPNCRTPERIAGTDDWYTPKGDSCLDICSDCVDSVFGRSFYRPLLRRSLPRNYNSVVRCAFGSRWSKYAWARTLEQRRSDFGILEDVAQIEVAADPCPGHKDSDRGWYGLKDTSGNFVDNFRICATDVRKIERLLPTLFGVFVALPPPRASAMNGLGCAFREDSTRFHTYLETLTAAHDKAIAAHKDAADLRPYLDIVLKKPPLRPCPRDKIRRSGLWHTFPDVPALTVCEECFHSVVEPEAKKKKSRVASMFSSYPQRVSGADGASCQLYSRCMKKVFFHAVKQDESDRLIRKASERWADQLLMKDHCDEIERWAKRLQREGMYGREEHYRAERDTARLENDWKKQWE